MLWATDCAEHVLPYFEAQFSDDNRPRKAIEAGRAWVRGELTLSEARAAAFAARAAGHAAATAHVAGHALLMLPGTLSKLPPTPRAPLTPALLPTNVIGRPGTFHDTFGQ